MELLLTDAFDVDVSPGKGYLSNSDDERCEPIENTIQLAWQPSFAEEYKRLLNEADADQDEPSSAGEKSLRHVQVEGNRPFIQAGRP